MSLLLNMLSRLVITFLPRSQRLLLSWLQSPSAVILEPRKIKSATVSTVSTSICHEVMGPDAMILVFWMLNFKPTFSLSSASVRFITFLSFFVPIFAWNVHMIWSHGPQPCPTQWDYEPCHVGPPKMDRSWWRVLTKSGQLEKGMANHFSILALRIPWKVWKEKKGRILKDEFPRSVDAQYATGDQWRTNFRKNEGKEPKQKQPSCGYDW